MAQTASVAILVYMDGKEREKGPLLLLDQRSPPTTTMREERWPSSRARSWGMVLVAGTEWVAVTLLPAPSLLLYTAYGDELLSEERSRDHPERSCIGAPPSWGSIPGPCPTQSNGIMFSHL